MGTQRQELRDDLIAALGAAEEMPPEDHRHLADVFLDKLEAGYELVPRAQAPDHRSPLMRQPMPVPTILPWRQIMTVGLVLFVVLPSVLWLTGATFAAAPGHHPPVFLPVIAFLLVMWFFRFRRWGWWGRDRIMR